jgi:hypothetical protein
MRTLSASVRGSSIGSPPEGYRARSSPPCAVALGLIRGATHSLRRLAGYAQATARAGEELLRFSRRDAECQRDLLQCYTVDLVHEKDFTLPRSESADKLVVVRGVLARVIEGAAEDCRTPRIIQLVKLPEVLIVLLEERVGFDLLREELGYRSAALRQRLSGAEYRGECPSFDAENGGQTPVLAPRTLQCLVQQLLRRRVIGRKLAESHTVAHLALRGLQELGIAGCERMIEQFASACAVCSSCGGVLLIDASVLHWCETDLITQSHESGLDDGQLPRHRRHYI